MWTVGGRNKGREKKSRKDNSSAKFFAIEKLMETASADAAQTRFGGITCTASVEDPPEGW